MHPPNPCDAVIAAPLAAAATAGAATPSTRSPRAPREEGRGRRTTARRIRHLWLAPGREADFADARRATARVRCSPGPRKSHWQQARFVPSVVALRDCRRRPGRRRTGPCTAAASSSRCASAPGSSSGVANQDWLAHRRGALRRAGGDRRRHRRRGPIYGRQDGQLPDHRRAGDAGLRFPCRSQGPQRALQAPSSRTGSCSAPSESVEPLAWKGSYCRRHRDGAVHAARASTSTPSTSTATATSIFMLGALPTSSAVSPTTSPSPAGQRGIRRASTRQAAPTDSSDRAALLAPDIVPSFTAAEMSAPAAPGCSGRRRLRRRPALLCAGRVAERRRSTELYRRHFQLLRDHALQLVELLRDGGHRARRGGETRSPQIGALRLAPRRAELRPGAGRRAEHRLDPAAQPSVAGPAFADLEPALQIEARTTSPACSVPAVSMPPDRPGMARRQGGGGEREFGRFVGHGGLRCRAASVATGPAEPILPKIDRATGRPPKKAPTPGPGRLRGLRGITLTATDMLWPRPPRMTPRKGTTSAKSAPQARMGRRSARWPLA